MNNLQIDEQILEYDKIICRHISNLNRVDRGVISQDILSQLRHFVEHIMLKVYAKFKSLEDIEDIQNNIKCAIKYVKNNQMFRDLSQFHHFLQVTVSHRALKEENSERLMLKYYEYLVYIRQFLKDEYKLDVLSNLEDFIIDIDESLNEYYSEIVKKVDKCNERITNNHKVERFYIQKIKPFLSNNKIYYEITFSQASDRASKTERTIAFTSLKITSFYAVKFTIVDDDIDLLGNKMLIRVIVDWEVSIRPCEFLNFIKLINKTKYTLENSEQYNINKYLTKTGLSLSEIIMFSDDAYLKIKNEINADYFLELLKEFQLQREKNQNGYNVIKYLMHNMRNRVIKSQYKEHYKFNHEIMEKEYIGGNFKLSNLYIAYESIPFCSSLKTHRTSIYDLFDCFDAKGREHEILAWLIKNNTEQRGMLFTPLDSLDSFNNLDELVQTHNNKLYDNEKQQGRKLIVQKNHIFIEDYKKDTTYIISKLKELSENGIDNYLNTVNDWIKNSNYKIDYSEKEELLTNMFTKSRVSLIYGPAGTGKTTLINHISHFFNDKKKVYLAYTNPAVNNLKRKMTVSNDCEFMTITKFKNTYKQGIGIYNVIFIDECSTVSNNDMKDIFKIINTNNVLILVGDNYQIESIKFGNWFDIARNFLPSYSICELTKMYRSKSEKLQALWDNVRKMGDNILEYLQAGEYSAKLDSSIFHPIEENEIILCLNYGGLYGINNIMQENNKNKEIWRDIHRYKVNDPILFNDYAERFFSRDENQIPIVHNNMKAKIVDFNKIDEGEATESIQFDIEIDKPLMDVGSDSFDFEIIANSINGNSIIRFKVNKNKSTDEDDYDYTSSKDVIPFQIAYAVSIHKAQGLEYDSVKLVIADEADERITHNTFYTAITRAKERLKIYWTQATEKSIIERIKPKNNHIDVSLLKNEIN